MGLLTLKLLATLGLAGTVALTIRCLRRLRGTTLVTAAQWALAGVLLWSVVLVGDLWLKEFTKGGADLLWYGVAVVCVCPPIAVLGARRPGASTWAFFVLLPLLLVLMWPAFAATRVWKFGTPLELEEPALIGFAVVLVMGCGNYFGTKFTLPALLYSVVVVLLLAPLSVVAPEMLRDKDRARCWATVILAASVAIARMRTIAIPASTEVWDRVWLDFIDSYGLVWGKRVMDRLNDAAQHEGWTARLEWQGFVWRPNVTEADQVATRERIDATLRWLMKRFVEPEWIDQRVRR